MQWFAAAHWFNSHFATLAPVVWGLHKAQDAINHPSGDPQSQSNDQITGANIGSGW